MIYMDCFTSRNNNLSLDTFTPSYFLVKPICYFQVKPTCYFLVKPTCYFLVKPTCTRVEPLSPSGPKIGMPSIITPKSGECCPVVLAAEATHMKEQ